MSVIDNAWGYCDNDKYKVRCNGASVWVFDSEGNQLARFKDVPYAYRAKFKPGTNIIAVKSTAGYLAFYDLDKLELLKKFRTGINYSQDDGFDFSSDGKYLFNIERYKDDLNTRLAVYDADSLELIDVPLDSELAGGLNNLECTEGEIYLLYSGYKKSYICQLAEREKVNSVRIPERLADKLSDYLDWRDSGFSPKQHDWDKENEAFYIGKKGPFTLKEVYEEYRTK